MGGAFETTSLYTPLRGPKGFVIYDPAVGGGRI